MNPNERDIVSMTRDAWSDHTRYVEYIEKEVERLSRLLKQDVVMGCLEEDADEE